MRLIKLNGHTKLKDSAHTIEIADQQNAAFDPAPLIAAIEMIADDHQINHAEISIAIVDDPTIRRLNKQYLNHDYETDVISFVLDWNEHDGKLAGQLIVSTDTAAELALDVGGTMQEELLLYVIHGMLHLVGYDDKQTAAAAEMRLTEQKYLAKFGIQHRGFQTQQSDQAAKGER